MGLLKWGVLPHRSTFSLDGDTRAYSYKFVYSTTTESDLTVLADLTTKYGHVRGGFIAGTRYYCSSITADQGSDGKIWTVTANYSQIMGTSALTAAVTPMDMPWDMSFGHTPKRRAWDRAYSQWTKFLYADGSTSSETPAHGRTAMDVAIVNSFGDVFDSPYEKEIKLQTITLKKNLSTSDYSSKAPLSFNDSMNNGEVTVCGTVIPKWAGLLAVEGTRQSYTNASGSPVFYVAVSYTITIDPELWAVRLVDQGIHFKKLAEPNINTTQTVTSPGLSAQRDPKPAKLNGNGYLLEHSNVGAAKAVAAALRGYFVNPELSWSTLGLPNAITVE